MISTIKAILTSSGATLDSIGMPMIRRRHKEPDGILRDRILRMVKANCFDSFVEIGIAQFVASRKASNSLHCEPDYKDIPLIEACAAIAVQTLMMGAQ